jgi:hypothetical protein
MLTSASSGNAAGQNAYFTDVHCQFIYAHFAFSDKGKLYLTEKNEREDEYL